MPTEIKSHLWKAIDRWENEGGAPYDVEQLSMLSSNKRANAESAKPASLSHIGTSRSIGDAPYPGLAAGFKPALRKIRKVAMVASSIRLAKHGAAAASIAAVLALWPAAALSQQVEFHHVFDNSLLDVAPKPNEQFTEAVREFHRTSQNPYADKPEDIEEGKQLYREYCQGCHMPDGSGGMGANLIGDKHIYPRITTDRGLFEVVFGGASGAMQPFGLRMSQDQILHVMTYVRTLMKK